MASLVIRKMLVSGFDIGGGTSDFVCCQRSSAKTNTGCGRFIKAHSQSVERIFIAWWRIIFDQGFSVSASTPKISAFIVFRSRRVGSANAFKLRKSIGR